MTERSAAEEHLRVIRSLMEKATTYRSISAEAAAIGGGLSLVAAFVPSDWLCPHLPTDRDLGRFLGVWAVVCTLTGAANIYFLYREAKRRGDHFFSSGMRLALSAILPPLLFGGWVTLVAGRDALFAVFLVSGWMVSYGFALLATATFAPRSLRFLGGCFLLSAIACVSNFSDPWGLFASPGYSGPGVIEDNLAYWGVRHAQLWMGATFGGFHLIYAACTWPRKSKSAPEP